MIIYPELFLTRPSQIRELIVLLANYIWHLDNRISWMVSVNANAHPPKAYHKGTYKMKITHYN